MKKSFSIIASILLIGLFALMNSCKEDDKEINPILEMISDDINNKVNTQFLTEVSTLNLKIIKVIQLAKENELDNSTQKVINKIEENHLKLNKEIKIIARENLIIIPDTVYDYSSDLDTLNNNRNYVYLVEIERLMQEEIKEFELIKDNTKNVEIQSFASEAINQIDDKLAEIDSALNNY